MANNKQIPPNSRLREWWIEINQNAECFADIVERVQTMNGVRCYGLIKHDKDQELQKQVDPQTGTILEVWRTKPEHWHLALELKNGCTFSALQKRLPGAHIEVMERKANAYQYLLHESPLSKDTKYNYPFDEIITNNASQVKMYIEAVNEREIFNEGDALRYIVEGVTNYFVFYKRFGLDQAKQWWKPYQRLLEESQHNHTMQAELEQLELDLKSEEEF